MSWASQSDICGVCLCDGFYTISSLCPPSLGTDGTPAHLLLFGNNCACKKLSSFVVRETCLDVTHVLCCSTGERFRNHSTGVPSNIKEFGRGVTRAPRFRNLVQRTLGFAQHLILIFVFRRQVKKVKGKGNSRTGYEGSEG
jgi:hypothetical protein